MPVYEFEGKRPQISKSAFVYPEAIIIGDVIVEKGCYIGPGACIRGDWGSVVVGPSSNVQENCVIHSAPDVVTSLAARSHIGHGSILHSVVLGEHVVVGMGAIIMDNANIGSGCLIGAGALVTAGTVIPPGRLYAGIPATDKGEVSKEMAEYLNYATSLYMGLPARCFKGLQEISLECVRVR